MSNGRDASTSEFQGSGGAIAQGSANATDGSSRQDQHGEALPFIQRQDDGVPQPMPAIPQPGYTPGAHVYLPPPPYGWVAHPPLEAGARSHHLPTTQVPRHQPTTQVPRHQPTTQAPHHLPTTQVPRHLLTTQAQAPRHQPTTQVPRHPRCMHASRGIRAASTIFCCQTLPCFKQAIVSEQLWKSISPSLTTQHAGSGTARA
jgi:hypothetical protein